MEDIMNYKPTLVSVTDNKGTFRYNIYLPEGSKREVDPETGYLYCYDAILGHTGVQEYYAYELKLDKKLGNPNVVVKVHRLPEDVFDEKTMKSIIGKQVTLGHPREKVTVKNKRYYDVGTVLSVHREGNLVMGDIVIDDEQVIKKVLSGDMKSLSLGYTADLIPLGNGEFKQENINVNHLAVVKVGRAKYAQIQDQEKEKKSMGFLDRLLGKKIKINDDDSITILQDEEPNTEDVNSEDENHQDIETKDITKEELDKVVEETKTKEVKKEVENQDEEEKDDDNDTEKSNEDSEKEKETKSEEKDVEDTQTEESDKEKEKQDMTKDEIKALLGELTGELKDTIKQEVKDQMSVFRDVQPRDSQDDQNDNENQKVELVADYKRDAQLKAVYYGKLTDPRQHDFSWDDLAEFRKKAEKIAVH